jgi:hypothetical protein
MMSKCLPEDLGFWASIDSNNGTLVPLDGLEPSDVAVMQVK